MPVWVSTLLGVGVGALLTYLGTALVESRRRGDDAAAERRRVLAQYLGRLYNVVGTISQWPQELPPSLLERLRAATWERSARVRMNDWIRSQRKMRKVFGDNLYEPLHRFTESYAALQLLTLEPSVRREIEATTDYVERLAVDRSETTLAEWETRRARLLEAIGAAGDAAAIEAAKPAARAADRLVAGARPTIRSGRSRMSEPTAPPAAAIRSHEASPTPPTSSDAFEPGYVEATVGELRDAVRAILDDEQDRGDSLNSRASGLAGFIGVILSVAAAAGATLGGSDAGDELESWVRVGVAGSLAVALAALVAAVILVVWKVLRPQPLLAVSTDDTDRYTQQPFVSYQPVQVHGYLVDAYAQALKAERSCNDGKARWLNRVYVLVCVALALVALAGGAATLDRNVGDSGRADTVREQPGGGREPAERAPGAGGGRGEPVPAPTDAADQ